MARFKAEGDTTARITQYVQALLALLKPLLVETGMRTAKQDPHVTGQIRLGHTVAASFSAEYTTGYHRRPTGRLRVQYVMQREGAYNNGIGNQNRPETKEGFDLEGMAQSILEAERRTVTVNHFDAKRKEDQKRAEALERKLVLKCDSEVNPKVKSYGENDFTLTLHCLTEEQCSKVLAALYAGKTHSPETHDERMAHRAQYPDK